MNFSDLISPLRWDDFVDKHLDKAYFFNNRSSVTAYDSIFKPDDIDGLLSFGNLRASDFRVFRNGEAVNVAKYADTRSASPHLQRIRPLLAKEEYRNGSTLIFEGVHRYHQGVHSLCRQLERDTGQRFQANVYVTPPNSEGFKPHFDGHDVFVCQISGTKEWQVSQTLKQEYRNSGQRAGAFKIDPDEVMDRFTIHQGDMLYVPRGQIHSARSTDQTSIHITIGMISQTWADYLKKAIELAADDNPEFNDTLPLWKLAAPQQDDFEEAVLNLTTSLSSISHFDIIEEILKSRSEVSHAVASIRPGGANPDSESTKYRVNPNILYLVSETEGKVNLEYHGLSISLPQKVRGIVDFILNEDSFTAADLHAKMDEKSARVLIHRLLRDDFLTLA